MVMMMPDKQAATQRMESARALTPQIRVIAGQIEGERLLPHSLIEQLARAEFFRMWVPRELGGDEVDPLTAMSVVEELARADASVG